MTVMILHPNPIEAAQYLCDKDLKRALIEAREFLLSALLSRGANGEELPSDYGKWFSLNTQTMHPFTMWLKKSHGNFSWLHDYAIAVAIEYVEAYGKVIDEDYTINDYHIDLAKMWHSQCDEKYIPSGKRTNFIACIPSEFHVNKYAMSNMNVVCSYRAYYKVLCLKYIDAQQRRNPPVLWSERELLAGLHTSVKEKPEVWRLVE